jgi:feruloyl esterase
MSIHAVAGEYAMSRPRIPWLAMPVALALAALGPWVHAAPPDCAALARLKLPGVTLTETRTLPPGPFEVPAMGPLAAHAVALPRFCRVRGTVAPGIRFELWLPARHWNGRFLAVGSGGFGGFIDYSSLTRRLRQGYAVTVNDTGHEGNGLAWMRNPGALLAWGHDATHRVTVAAKRIVHAYYGTGPAHAYFEGCSTGGDQAMEEAEFFPGDFNGIVAESPGMDYTGLMFSFLWGLRAAARHGELSEPKLLLLHHYVMTLCKARDGLLEHPESCHVNLAPLVCTGRDGPTCLTPGQARTAELIYQGPRDPRTGQQIYPGFVPGSEADPAYTGPLAAFYGWSMIQGPLARDYAIPLLEETVFGTGWNWRTFDFDRGVVRVDRVLAGKIDAMNPDLRAFAAHGGKLIMVQGWGDPYNAQTVPIEYRRRVISVFAAAGHRRRAVRRVNGFFRLFMAPGMSHCLWGPGPSQAHALASVERWVERHRAPRKLIAAQVAPGALTARPGAMRRPLCPYPQAAHYLGGNPNRARDYRCETPAAR